MESHSGVVPATQPNTQHSIYFTRYFVQADQLVKASKHNVVW